MRKKPRESAFRVHALSGPMRFVYRMTMKPPCMLHSSLRIWFSVWLCGVRCASGMIKLCRGPLPCRPHVREANEKDMSPRRGTYKGRMYSTCVQDTRLSGYCMLKKA
jgi:hypothetical protein